MCSDPCSGITNLDPTPMPLSELIELGAGLTEWHLSGGGCGAAPTIPELFPLMLPLRRASVIDGRHCSEEDLDAYSVFTEAWKK